MNTEKPVVDYLEIPLVSEPTVGSSTVVFPLNHPNPYGFVSNRNPVRTSTIQAIIDSNFFETRNTIYRKVGVYSEEAIEEYHAKRKHSANI